MSNFIPPQLAEALNGALLIMLLIMVGLFADYIRRGVIASHRMGRSFRLYSSENKTAVALITLGVGMSLKTFATWWGLHLANHQIDKHTAASFILIPCLLAGTAIAIWGLICLLRALSRYDWPAYLWAAFTIMACAFGVWFAL